MTLPRQSHCCRSVHSVSNRGDSKVHSSFPIPSVQAYLAKDVLRIRATPFGANDRNTRDFNRLHEHGFFSCKSKCDGTSRTFCRSESNTGPHTSLPDVGQIPTRTKRSRDSKVETGKPVQILSSIINANEKITQERGQNTDGLRALMGFPSIFQSFTMSSTAWSKTSV